MPKFCLQVMGGKRQGQALEVMLGESKSNASSLPLGMVLGRTPFSSPRPRAWGKCSNSGHPALWDLLMVWPQQKLHWEGKERLKHGRFVDIVTL